MASLGKVGLDDESRELLGALSRAIQALADELHEYNHPRVEYEVVNDAGTVVRITREGDQL